MYEKLYSISKEDLLIKLSVLKAENTLLKKNLQEWGKDKSYIQELESKIAQLKVKKRDNRYVEYLELQIKNQKKRIKNQKKRIKNQKKRIKNQKEANATLNKELFKTKLKT